MLGLFQFHYPQIQKKTYLCTLIACPPMVGRTVNQYIKII